MLHALTRFFRYHWRLMRGKPLIEYVCPICGGSESNPQPCLTCPCRDEEF